MHACRICQEGSPAPTAPPVQQQGPAGSSLVVPAATRSHPSLQLCTWSCSARSHALHQRGHLTTLERPWPDAGCGSRPHLPPSPNSLTPRTLQLPPTHSTTALAAPASLSARHLPAAQCQPCLTCPRPLLRPLVGLPAALLALPAGAPPLAALAAPLNAMPGSTGVPSEGTEGAVAPVTLLLELRPAPTVVPAAPAAPASLLYCCASGAAAA